ncbi:MAG TPA: hypothetical protein DIC30_09500 [Oceanospirillales bacterium]|nr:hypothetical protein [Oleispira sp.]HCM06231.1 hypothetical protein [Oceanospirillales bacterium]
MTLIQPLLFEGREVPVVTGIHGASLPVGSAIASMLWKAFAEITKVAVASNTYVQLKIVWSICIGCAGHLPQDAVVELIGTYLQRAKQAIQVRQKAIFELIDKEFDSR